jgi:hypothetical protein
MGAHSSDLAMLGFYKVDGTSAGDLRLLRVALGSVAPVYGMAGLMALITVQRRVPPVAAVVLTIVAGAVGCIFVVPAFIAGVCSTFGMCP